MGRRELTQIGCFTPAGEFTFSYDPKWGRRDCEERFNVAWRGFEARVRASVSIHRLAEMRSGLLVQLLADFPSPAPVG
jgi:hypothetical protein